MRKIMDKKALVEKAKQLKPERKNYTFRLKVELYEEFESFCKKNGTKPTALLEEILRSFIESN